MILTITDSFGVAVLQGDHAANHHSHDTPFARSHRKRKLNQPTGIPLCRP